jgi:hypothetical protein
MTQSGHYERLTTNQRARVSRSQSRDCGVLLAASERLFMQTSHRRAYLSGGEA